MEKMILEIIKKKNLRNLWPKSKKNYQFFYWKLKKSYNENVYYLVKIKLRKLQKDCLILN